MRQLNRPARKLRPAAIVLVLLSHGLLILVFTFVRQSSRDEPERQLVFLSLWPDMPANEKVTAQEFPEQQPSPRRSALTPRTATFAPPPASIAPSTAITVPDESAVPGESPRPNIDWRAEAAAVAKLHAAPTAPQEFAPPPKAMRKPCEKKKSTWEWNKEEKSYGIAPLPYVKLGKRCVVGLGFFGCSLQKPPEANSHLLDDMRDGKTAPSSVPDPDICE
jgi:hypothetical protein